MQRQRRANNPHNYDERGRVNKHGKRRLHWHDSRGYQATRRRHATQERKLAAHRKSLHGQLVNDLVRVGNHMQIEKTSFKGWQKMYGRSVGLRAPGLFVAHLTRIVEKTGGTLSARSNVSHQTVAVLSQLQALREKALPRSFGIPEARARRPKSPQPNRQELASLSRRGRLEALGLAQEPPLL